MERWYLGNRESILAEINHQLEAHVFRNDRPLAPNVIALKNSTSTFGGSRWTCIQYWEKWFQNDSFASYRIFNSSRIVISAKVTSDRTFETTDHLRY